jgi:putative redox protein
MTRNVRLEAGSTPYLEIVSIGPHVLQADEAMEAGGSDAGPDPYELLLSALGACTSITVRMYADRKNWPLQAVRVGLSYARSHAEDCAVCDAQIETPERIEMEISLEGALSEAQRSRLMEIASRCPVHRTLQSRIEIRQRPA